MTYKTYPLNIEITIDNQAFMHVDADFGMSVIEDNNAIHIDQYTHTLAFYNYGTNKIEHFTIKTTANGFLLPAEIVTYL
jgi:hypothetical protein